MSLPRTLAWGSLDEPDPSTPEDRRPMSELLRLLPLVILVGAVSADRFGIRWHGINLRLELIAAGVLALWAVVTLRVAAIRIGLVEWCLAGWLAVGAFSSVVFSPAPRESLRLTLVMVGMVALYGLTVLFLRSNADLARLAGIWVAVGTVVATIGIVEGTLYALFDWHAGIAFDGSSAGSITVFAPRVTSTMWEANIFASYLLTVWAMAFALSRTPAAQTRLRKWALRVAMGVITAGIVISTTRVAWVVAPVLMLAMVLVAMRLGLLAGRRLLGDFVNPNLAGIAVGLALVTAMSVVACPTPAPTSTAGGSRPASPLASSNSGPSSGPPPAAANPLRGPGCFAGGSLFMQHSHGFFAASSTSSFTGRLTIAKQALKGWLHRPILGQGSGSYGYVFGAAAGGWLGNLPLHILFDTGIVGLMLLLFALVAAGRPAIRALTTAAASSWETTHFVLFGLVAGTLALLITYQFTDGTWLGFTWVLFGMLVAAGRLTRGIGQRLRSA